MVKISKEKFEKLKSIIDYLHSHNKNLTKTQYYYIDDAKEILDEV